MQLNFFKFYFIAFSIVLNIAILSTEAAALEARVEHADGITVRGIFFKDLEIPKATLTTLFKPEDGDSTKVKVKGELTIHEGATLALRRIIEFSFRPYGFMKRPGELDFSRSSEGHLTLQNLMDNLPEILKARYSSIIYLSTGYVYWDSRVVKMCSDITSIPVGTPVSIMTLYVY